MNHRSKLNGYRNVEELEEALTKQAAESDWHDHAIARGIPLADFEPLDRTPHPADDGELDWR